MGQPHRHHRGPRHAAPEPSSGPRHAAPELPSAPERPTRAIGAWYEFDDRPAPAPRRRPGWYPGSRRRLTGFGSVAAGFIAVALVLGVLLTRHTDSPRADAPRPTPQSPSAPQSPRAPAPSPTASPAATLSDAVAKGINAQLAGMRCAPVTVSPSLATAARDHMDSMMRTGYYDVREPDGNGPTDRAKAAGYRGDRVQESIVLGVDSAADLPALAFPTPSRGAEAIPVTANVVAADTLSCGWKWLGADKDTDSRGVPVWVVILGR